MAEKLTEVEARVVGALIEKQLTTPEYYPLTLNSLVAACNQKSNRDPVVSYDEETVQKALDILRDKNIVYVFYGSTSRVPKYKHILPDVLGTRTVGNGNFVRFDAARRANSRRTARTHKSPLRIFRHRRSQRNARKFDAARRTA